MIRLTLLLLLPTLAGCMAAKVVTLPVKAAGTAIETAWDAATTTQREADEDRGKALRKAEERAARDRGRAEPARTSAPR
ncbi:MAG: hypothetical protein NZM40_03320 [Sphingomonadaceae bacterium]|uniref:DUF6726 family protein n=1 Tax=Thermaurantiacus sp. TaxID=2820283 RepID=UPI00298F37F9|nr:DUF6726 family protein [Thermaurantiacus sp.]MCS6986454.1 hypothetical protein [Sphingomonadaceae bacterium]MDW8414285.1 hypothetical protein [Thermaurantiacus sp.]